MTARKPRATGQEDLVLPEEVTEQIGEFQGVADEVGYVHVVGAEVRRVGLAGSSLIPVDDDEVLFECTPLVEFDPGGHGEAWSTVEDQQDGFAGVGTANHDPLLDSTEGDLFEGGDAVGKSVPASVGDGGRERFSCRP
jgi:hypothetical protein